MRKNWAKHQELCVRSILDGPVLGKMESILNTYERFQCLFSLGLSIYQKNSRTRFIPKKDGAREPGEFRPITISSVIVRLTPYWLRGFPHPYTVRPTIERVPELRRLHRQHDPLGPYPHDDVSKTFDSISHSTILNSLSYGFPEVFTAYVEELY